jgi:hypothetical protein
VINKAFFNFISSSDVIFLNKVCAPIRGREVDPCSEVMYFFFFFFFLPCRQQWVLSSNMNTLMSGALLPFYFQNTYLNILEAWLFYIINGCLQYSMHCFCKCYAVVLCPA